MPTSWPNGLARSGKKQRWTRVAPTRSTPTPTTSWSEFEQTAPELARLGRERIDAFGFVFLGTLRKDGGPRVNPVEAHIVEGELTHALMKGSTKVLDLLRDPRAYLHTPILDANLGAPGEFKLRARALPVEDQRLRTAIRDAVEQRSRWRPPEDWHFFAIDVESAAFHEYDPEKQLHHVKRWTPARGYEDSQRTIET